MNLVLLYFAVKYHGEWKSIYDALIKKEQISPGDLYDLEKSLQCKYTTILNNDYPEELKSVDHPPFVIFYVGNLNLISHNQNKLIFISNSNRIYTDNYLIKLYNDLNSANFIPVISTNLNIDVEKNFEHKMFICEKPILNYLYKESIKKSLYLSLIYNKNTKKDNFLECQINLMHGLLKRVLILPSENESLIHRKIECLSNRGSELMAIPDNANNNSMSNLWIKNGAKLVDRASDIINRM
ncbi:hypothetical protein [Spiroplasma endosymbiont of Labia minor]|uniref:hypothetical protein n=1 Tax=Spiroplasma endosymbiont of Labia minor TaxID=3066305 RepID=UPI0030D00348